MEGRKRARAPKGEGGEAGSSKQHLPTVRYRYGIFCGCCCFVVESTCHTFTFTCQFTVGASGEELASRHTRSLA